MSDLRDRIADKLRDADDEYANTGEGPTANELADAILAMPEIAQAQARAEAAEARFIEQRDSLVSVTKKLVKTEARLAEKEGPSMTDAPETIWARRHTTGVVEAADYKIEGEQEYRRADLHATDKQAFVNEKVKELVEALIPYAALARHHAADAPEWGPFDSVTAQVSIRNLRDARSALAGMEKE